MTKEQIRTKFDRWAERVEHTPFENDLDNATPVSYTHLQDAINTAAKEYQAAVDAANAKCNDTSEIIAQGYAKNADLAHAWSEEQAMIAARCV